MRSGSRTLSTLLVLLALFGCRPKDNVLTPDGDGAEPHGDEAGDGDGAGDGDATDRGEDGSDAVGDNDDLADDEGDWLADGGMLGAKDPDCDLTGIWIGKQVTVSIDDAISAEQFANNWYYLEFEQSGESFRVSKHMDCGIEVRGTTDVTLGDPTTKALARHNIQTGRRGTMAKRGATCAFEADRFWSVRGLDEESYVPRPRNTARSIADVRAELPLPGESDFDQTEDWDKDGEPGIAWLSGFGTRHTVQRDWTRWFSDAEHAFAASSNWTDDVIVRADFDNEEQILKAPFKIGSSPDKTAKHILRLRFLGRDRSDARAKAIVKDSVLATCKAIQAALPAAKGLE